MNIPAIKEAVDKAIIIKLDFAPSNVTYQSGTRQRRYGKGTYKTPELKTVEGHYAASLIPHTPPKPLEGPLCLWLDFVYPWRKSEPKKNTLGGNRFKDTQPDLDNLEKTFIDLMERCRFFHNDGQIASKRTTKWWGAYPGITIQLMKAEQL